MGEGAREALITHVIVRTLQATYCLSCNAHGGTLVKAVRLVATSVRTWCGQQIAQCPKKSVDTRLVRTITCSFPSFWLSELERRLLHVASCSRVSVYTLPPEASPCRPVLGSWSINTVVPSVKVCLAAAQKCVTDSLQSLAQPALLELGP
jgi:hypothetical protein